MFASIIRTVMFALLLCGQNTNLYTESVSSETRSPNNSYDSIHLINWSWRFTGCDNVKLKIHMHVIKTNYGSLLAKSELTIENNGVNTVSVVFMLLPMQFLHHFSRVKMPCFWKNWNCKVARCNACLFKIKAGFFCILTNTNK